MILTNTNDSSKESREKLLFICSRLKSLYEKECVQLIHPSYGSTVVDITESDRQQLISGHFIISVFFVLKPSCNLIYRELFYEACNCGVFDLVCRKLIALLLS